MTSSHRSPIGRPGKESDPATADVLYSQAWPPPPPMYAGPVKPPGHGLHIAALVLGIVGIVIGLIPWFFLVPMVCGPLAIIFGFMARRGGKRVGVKQGRSGIVLGIVASILAVVGLLIINEAFETLEEDLDGIDRELQEDLEDIDRESQDPEEPDRG